MSGIATWCANPTKPMSRLKAQSGDGRSRELVGETASWKSEQQLGTNGYSPSHGSSGSMIWAFLFAIWPRIFAKRAFVFFSCHRRAREQWGRRTRRAQHGLASSPRGFASFLILIRMRGVARSRNAQAKQGNANYRYSSKSRPGNHTA